MQIVSLHDRSSLIRLHIRTIVQLSNRVNSQSFHYRFNRRRISYKSTWSIRLPPPQQKKHCLKWDSLVASQDVEERAFTGSGRSHDGRQLSRPKFSTHPMENLLLHCEKETQELTGSYISHSRSWWSSGSRACHWTQGSRVYARLKMMDFNGDKNS
jgi:hypothetical protein